MDIKVLGSGCANCNRLEQVTKDALSKLGIDEAVEHVGDPREYMAYGVMTTPALVIGERVRVAGRVPSVDDVVAIIQRARAED
jgi:small redox-active disulfide protein 2